ncbi:hypothetical protein H8699_02200 [Christensenellaceae bacterium NSJ-44]|uniref:Uncharacterized protein n=1 Tax=Luoshenia tenuis TaxID=2763654 RepID=A0A926CZ25_9FIRM|nr:hypothetical protein [Luoshenia tenuis]MBC8528251.1 hypothetical protein [Luoshenia tenuis]
MESQKLADVLDYLRSCKSTMRIAIDEQHEQEALTQDIEHKLELEKLTYHETAKLGLMLRDARQKRRRAKDLAEILEPLVLWIEENETSIKALERTLGKMRTKEKNHNLRRYAPRVLNEG